MDLMTIASIGMQNDQTRMETISNNIANVTTPGYKKQIAANAAFQLQLEGAAGANLGLRGAVPGSPATLMSIDPGAGALRPTGSKQDVAIDGNSFFELTTANGPAYTRQGSLHVDIAGRLVGAQGLPVQGEGGEIRLANAAFTIGADGEVRQDGRVAGRLKRVRFEQASALTPLGNALYAQGAATVAEAQAKDSLRIGFQEASNVNSPQEMVRLTETVRHFEALAKIVQGYDETLEKTIRKLGDF